VSVIYGSVRVGCLTCLAPCDVFVLAEIAAGVALQEQRGNGLHTPRLGK